MYGTVFFGFILAVLLCACSKQEEQPHQFSSYDYRMDGSRSVPDIGVPTQVTSVVTGSGGVLSQMVSLSNSKYIVAQDNQLFIGDEKTSKLFASIPDGGSITNILADTTGIYSIHLNGDFEIFDTSGKLRLHDSYDFGKCKVDEGYAILADSEFILSGINYKLNEMKPSPFLGAYLIGTGNSLGRIDSMAAINSLIYDSQTHQIIAAGDSEIWYFSLDKKINSYTRLHQRFISNLCLCGRNHEKLAFGYLESSNGERTMNVGIFSNSAGKLKMESSHEVPYLPVNIASNGPVILSSGFYDSGNELTSGIDAFSADDTLKLWQRRFTYPVAAPVAVSQKYVYFTLTFSTQAAVPAQSIFYTLDLATGKTLGEVAINGAQNGFVPGIPMPLGESALMLADRNKPVIYFLKP